MILHLDMDAFFAAVEVLDRPELAGTCLVVGGAGPRSVVAAASYEARRFGIHSAMPMTTARRRCAQLVIVAPRRRRYQEISRRVMRVLECFSPVVEPVSIDEAYLDLGGSRRLLGDPLAVGRAVKQRIRQETHLACSVGIAPVRFLAKIASDMRKPDGLMVIAPDEVAAVIEALPVARVPGVGPQAQKSLARLGISRLGQVRTLPEAMVTGALGVFGRRLRDLAHGIDPTTVTPHSPAKSLSSEQTLDEDSRDRQQLRQLLLHHCLSVGRHLRALDLRARSVVLKLRHGDFSLHTRSRTLPRAAQAGAALFQAAAELLDDYPLTSPIRLIGVGASNLIGTGEPRQGSLFGDEPEQECRWERVERAVDRVAERFGRGALRRASQPEVEEEPPV